MKNTIENNRRIWDAEWDWSQDGDEWVGQAERCGRPYDEWKRSVVDRFLAPRITSQTAVLEIGPGHGRWTREIAPRCGHLVLADLSASCIEHCRARLADRADVAYHVTDGRSLTGVADASIDFAWSFDAFVHMDRDVIAAYLGELARVLRSGGAATIHHAGRRHAFLMLRWMRALGGPAASLYKLLSMGQRGDGDGWRSDVSARLFADMAGSCGLRVVSQVRRWGEGDAFGVPRFRDVVTTLERP